MGDCILLKVIGVTTYNGTSRSGRPYDYFTPRDPGLSFAQTH